MRPLFLTTILLLAAVGGACAPAPAPPPAPDLAAAESEIRAADALWLKAAQAKDVAGEASVFATDGMAYRPNMQPMIGPAPYKIYLEKDYAENPKGIVHWVTEKIDVATSGDLAVQTGTVHVSSMGPKADIADTMRFVTVWKKTDGQWKVAHDIAVSVTTPPKK